ncbi:hypothetical protein MUK42_16990 [Musa troglodytarum]|uniref:Uncharacterized protein n=1 Tax=Musa troglodytarum TaxID=320322 RepID=A0A9E7KP89_9LILI|nr:hypothetical protein MUK42_16990 [Musa troglodytarum]
MSQSVAHRQPVLLASPSRGPRAFLGALPSPGSSSNEDRPPDQQSSPFNKQPTSKRMIMARNLTLLSCPVLLGNLLGFVFLMHLPLESRLGASTNFISRMNNFSAVGDFTVADLFFVSWSSSSEQHGAVKPDPEDQSFGCLATVTDTIGSLWTRHFVSHRDLSERLVSQNQHGS